MTDPHVARPSVDDLPPDAPLTDGTVPDELPDEAPTTGVPAVDTALAPLADLGALPVHDHVERFEAVHTGLQQALDGALQGSLAESAPDHATRQPGAPDTGEG